ncbi:MAG TPA: HAD-IA family hydrolase [Candidatus Eisenbergiella merdipullorum]|uniref:HAD-IA family hydrolase n=1 Tax=Candidatus Eisenbergiella merdipullorum TaxID=2838553 RepID=A0A9D2IAL6_9FIRM|nr:HAD-IA family hydrolase [Candidatus Eisenbergiella merdipullorum]
MRKPKMILFDYGQTLADEGCFSGVKGAEAVLQYAVKNPCRRTAEEVQQEADRLNRALGRLGPATGHMYHVEIPNHMFNAYLYESQGIELSLSPDQIDEVFWNAAAPGKPTEGIENFLIWLKEQGIRSGVISNISYSGSVVKKRIYELLPEHSFEFILASSEYLFRKPDRRIFELALKKAELSPEEVWYIGDNYECDVMGARNAGIFPVWYVGVSERSFEKREDVWMVRSWEEVKDGLRN